MSTVTVSPLEAHAEIHENERAATLAAIATANAAIAIAVVHLRQLVDAASALAQTVAEAGPR